MNICIFSGHLGSDAQTTYLQSGTPVTTWSIATKSGTGDYETTTWIKCKLFKREKLAPYLTKGTKITVSGELANREYEDRDGNKRTILELIVREVVLPPKQKNQQEQPQAPANEMDEAPF